MRVSIPKKPRVAIIIERIFANAAKTGVAPTMGFYPK